MPHRDISRTTLVLGGVPIPAGSDGDAFSISLGDPASVTRSLSTTIFNRMRNPGGTLTIQCYPEDPAYAILVRIFGARRSAPVRIPLPGAFKNAVNGDNVAWPDCELVNEGDVIGSQETQLTTWVIELSKPVRALRPAVI